MRNVDRLTNARIKDARGFLRELVDLAEEQGWEMRAKDVGLLFFPPAHVARQGMGQLYARDPGTDSHTQKALRDRFRKAGMKFPQDEPIERKPKVTAPMTTASTATGGMIAAQASAPALDAFAQIRQKLSAVITLLSEIEQLVGKVESDNAHVRKVRDALKLLGSLE